MQYIPEAIGDWPPFPQISPLTGPREGGTRVTIEGENLGLQVKEITHVQVAGVRCSSVPSQYISAERSACIRVRIWTRVATSVQAACADTACLCVQDCVRHGRGPPPSFPWRTRGAVHRRLQRRVPDPLLADVLLCGARGAEVCHFSDYQLPVVIFPGPFFFLL